MTEPDPRRPRVFGIGLNKTATTSLHRAMQILGYRSLHWGGPSVRRAVEAAQARGAALLDDLDPVYDAFSDVEPISKGYALLDAQYPGSRFVLTVRPVDEWLDSRRRHVERNQERARAGQYTGAFLVVDVDAWRDEWQQHVHGVRRYFAGRSDFLEIDLTAGAGWRPLCSLLGVEEPDVAFPWVNRDATSSRD